MPPRPSRLVTGFLFAALVFTLPGCAGSADGERRTPTVINVPADAPTVRQAVDRAAAGDLVLLAPGTYRETVKITKPGVTLRGADRSGVVVDGEGRRANGIVVTAPGVAVENLTVANHLVNGLLVTGQTVDGEGMAHGSDGYQPLDTDKFPPLSGYRVSHVTAYDNGLYGIYVFDARDGEIVDNYASGSADSGIYLGQCKPCRALVARNVAERNAVGYEGANAGGETYVAGNRFTGNRVGLTILSDYQEALVPQESATVVGNLVSRNNEPVTPAQADGAFGLGVGIAGGQRNTVLRNRVEGNADAGVAIASSADIPPVGNRFEANVFAGNGVDVGYHATPSAAGRDNCVAGPVAKAVPDDAVARMCSPVPSSGVARRTPSAPAGVPFLKIPAPGPQPSMPSPRTRPASAARWDPAGFDLAAYPLPGDDLLADRTRRAG